MMKQPSRHLRVVVLAGVVLVSALALVARPAPASAATPCWKALLIDWYDGRIDNTYPLHCYRDALHHLPPDVQTYSSAHDDIERALQSAQARLRANGKKVGPDTLIVPPKGGNQAHRATRTTTTTTISPIRSPGRQQKGLGKLVDKLNPSSPSSLPLPLLVLGGLAILLVAAGGAGLLAKRFQGRKPSS